MKPFIYALVASTTLVGSPVLAGNAEMMEQRGRQLIELSEDVVQQLSQGKIREGRIVFEARVVQPPGGGQVIILDRADVHAPETEPSGVLKEQSIPALPATPPPVGLRGSAAAFDAPTAKQRVNRVIDDHPNAQMIELDGSALKDLSQRLPVGSGTTKQGAYLIYW